MYLQRRNRILRQSPSIRSMVAETTLTPNDFIAPLFIDEGENVSFEIPSMPGYYRYSIDNTIKEVNELWSLGIKSVLLFIKAPDELKDNTGKEAWNDDGLMQRSIKAIKNALPEMIVMTDVALDPYSSYGHDGIVENGEIVNDPTVDALVKMSLSHAKAGADFVAPSDMMDGRIGAIREALEKIILPKQASWRIAQNMLLVFTARSAMRWILPRDLAIKKPIKWIMPIALKQSKKRLWMKRKEQILLW